jgi:hypothetical protein
MMQTGFSPCYIQGMDSRLQFGLRGMFLGMAAAALMAGLFRWLGTETAVILLPAGLLLWPLRRANWLAAFGRAALVIATVVGGMYVLSLLMGEGY